MVVFNKLLLSCRLLITILGYIRLSQQSWGLIGGKNTDWRQRGDVRFLTPPSPCQPLPSSSARAQGLLPCFLEAAPGESEGGQGPPRGSGKSSLWLGEQPSDQKTLAREKCGKD